MSSVHVPKHGVMLDLEVCAFYWRLGRDRLAALGQDGGRAGEGLREAQDALRAAMLEHAERRMSVNRHVSPTCADMAAESESDGLVSTAVMADRLSVGARHAYRLARDAGVESVARDAWRSTDVDRLVALRRSA